MPPPSRSIVLRRKERSRRGLVLDLWFREISTAASRLALMSCQVRSVDPSVGRGHRTITSFTLLRHTHAARRPLRPLI